MEETENLNSWNAWKNKRVYLVLKNKRRFSGLIVEVEIVNSDLIFLTILDKYNARVTFAHSEIELIQQQELIKKEENKKNG